MEMSAADCVNPLFVPADKPELFAKAAASEADAIILDLEDAVAPEAKDAARQSLPAAMSLLANKPTILRINAHGTIWHQADLAVAADLNLEALMLPKTEDLKSVNDARSASGKSIIVLIESAQGLVSSRELSCSGQVMRLAFGSIDFCVDLGMDHTREALLAARSEIVLASRLGKLPAPLDGISASIDDIVLIEQEANYAHSLGFGGKLCIHPRQIPLVRRGFQPSVDEIVWARRVLAVSDGGVVVVDGQMVDFPVRLRAERILATIV